MSLVIAIDGPAASGKSSTALWVAKELGLKHLDSGSLYRAITAAYLRAIPSGAAWDEDLLMRSANRCGFIATGQSFLPAIDGRIVDDEARSSAVNMQVSRVAQVPAVRELVNSRMRAVAETNDVVVDGRDIGTAVFPNAVLKIFLVADAWERARRRLIQQGGAEPGDDEIAAETERLVHRDARDATQSVQANDAILIDTTSLTQEEQVERIVALAKAATQRLARHSR